MLAVFSVHLLFSIPSHNWFIDSRHDHLGLRYLYLAGWKLTLLCSFPIAPPRSAAPAMASSAEHHISISGTFCWAVTWGRRDTALLGSQRGFCFLHIGDKLLIIRYLCLNFI